jgi:hypothetical protein
MKKIFCLILWVYSLVGSLAAQSSGWKKSNFINSQYLYSIKCINFDTVIAVGDTGYIVRTVNNGANWSVIPKVTNNTLFKVDFIDKQIGYAVGANGTVLKTTNEGQTWSNIGIHTNLNLMSLSFINKDTGWVAGGTVGLTGAFTAGSNIGILLKTINGGTSWTIDSTFKPITSVFLMSNDTGYLCTSYLNGRYHSSLCRTTNSGNSFTELKKDSTGEYFIDVQFMNSKEGYLAYNGHSGSGGIYRSTNFGNTCLNIIPFYYMRNLFVLDSCSIFYSYSDVPACGFVGHDRCTNSDFNSNPNTWMAASFINKNKGFGVSGFLFCSGSCIYKLDTVSAPVNIREKDLLKMNLFPNPTSGVISISMEEGIDIPGIKVYLYNSLGQKLLIPNACIDKQLRIDMSEFPKGIYLIKIMREGISVQIEKVIKY